MCCRCEIRQANCKADACYVNNGCDADVCQYAPVECTESDICHKNARCDPEKGDAGECVEDDVTCYEPEQRETHADICALPYQEEGTAICNPDKGGCKHIDWEWDDNRVCNRRRSDDDASTDHRFPCYDLWCSHRRTPREEPLEGQADAYAPYHCYEDPRFSVSHRNCLINECEVTDDGLKDVNRVCTEEGTDRDGNACPACT